MQVDEQIQLSEEDADAAFSAGFNGGEAAAAPEPVVTEENVAVSEPAPEAFAQEENKEQQAPAPQTEERDPFKEIEKLSARLRNYEGHVGGIKTSIDKLNTQVSETAKAAASRQGADIPTTAQVNAAMKDGEKYKAFREEFPEYADAMEEAMSAQSASIEQSVLSKVPKVDTSGLMTAQEFETLIPIYVKYPNWKKTVNTEDFSKWFASQPAEIQALGDSENPDDVIGVIEKFEARQKPASQSNRLERSVAPTNGKSSAQKPSSKTADEEFSAGFKKVRSG